MARANNKEYDCLLIYNHARSRLSRLEDNELSLRIVESTDDRLRQWGYTKNHYYDRDSIPGRNVFSELFRVVDSSQYVLIFLTRGFLTNCWIRYCQMAAFKKLIDESTRPDQIASHRVIPILINITEDEVPQELGQLTHICFRDDWEVDGPEWQKLKRALDGQSVQETRSGGIGDVRPPATPNHFGQGIPESCNEDPSVHGEPRATQSRNFACNSSVASLSANPEAVSRSPISESEEATLVKDTIHVDSFRSSELFASGGSELRTSTSLSKNQQGPLKPQHAPTLNGVEGDHVTLSGHGSGSFGNEWGNNQLGRSPHVPRLSEAALPVTHTSDVMPGSRSHDNIPQRSGILHLLSRDVEPDAQESLPIVPLSPSGDGSDTSPQTDRVIEQSSPAGARNDPSSQTDGVDDSGVDLSGSLHGPEGDTLTLASLMEGSTSSALSSPSSENTNSVHINKDEPDIGVTQSRAGPATEERENRPSFFSQAIHFTLHALFNPDKVYTPL